MKGHPISQRRACVLIGVDPKTVRREHPPDSPEIRVEMNKIAEKRRRFGHRIGQTKEVTIHIPMAIHGDFREKSFDCLLHSLMTRKRKLASSALWPMGDTDADAEQLQKMLAEEISSTDPGDPVQSAIKRTFERDQSPMPEKLDDQSYRYE